MGIFLYNLYTEIHKIVSVMLEADEENFQHLKYFNFKTITNAKKSNFYPIKRDKIIGKSL